MTPAAKHHRARRLALQGLCCLDVQGPEALELVLEFIRDSREDPQTVAEAEGMLLSAFAVRDQADVLLGGQSEHWDVARMALVDRNVLRLAVWELMAGRAPRKVVISEAVRLAKEFSTAESGRFINGVLDAASRRLDELDNQRHGRDSRDARDAEEPVVDSQ
ncbi:MAG: transcription antitermination factor NusB [Planctomycetales bacterium 4484_123]|nr:MAG: transcription antitermination factor NusB [Planctomycetales bacterium 4484_123]